MKNENILSNEEFNNRIIDNIRIFTKMRGISIGDLEKAIGRSQGYISRIRSGKKCMNAYLIYEIINILGIDVKELLEERDFELIELKEKADELGYKLIPKNKED